MRRRAGAFAARGRAGLAALPAVAAVAVVVGACGAAAPGADAAGADSPAAVRPAQADTAPGTGLGPPEPPALRTVRTEPVVGRTGPGGEPFEVALRTPDPTSYLSRRIGTMTFDLGLRLRRPDLGQYPCTSCHSPGDAAIRSPERADDAHQDIRAVHPAETGAACGTCHQPGHVDRLVLGTGETTTLDHAYRLCAQCHYAQVDAWAGGAHGKRLDGWSRRRVLMGCADCHDPHRPGLEPRLPFPGPAIPRTGRRNR